MWAPSDYDDNGWLKLPLLFWLILLLQARTWVLFALAGASRGQGEAILTLIYPDRQLFWLGMAAGLPAAATLVLSGRRHRFARLWHAWRPVPIVAQLALTLWQLWLLLQGAPGIAASLLLIIDCFALLWLAASRRLRVCFYAPAD
jgi:hypothetical protein